MKNTQLHIATDIKYKCKNCQNDDIGGNISEKREKFVVKVPPKNGKTEIKINIIMSRANLKFGSLNLVTVNLYLYFMIRL